MKNADKGNKYDNEHLGIGGKNQSIVQLGNKITTGSDNPKKKNTAFNENTKKMKRLNFKKTSFINEDHIMDLIPEEYKINENRFYMKDKDDNDYLIEWSEDEGKGVILEHTNETLINESFDKFNKLINYKSSDHMKTTSGSMRINENNKVGELLAKIKEQK